MLFLLAETCSCLSTSKDYTVLTEHLLVFLWYLDTTGNNRLTADTSLHSCTHPTREIFQLAVLLAGQWRLSRRQLSLSSKPEHHKSVSTPRHLPTYPSQTLGCFHQLPDKYGSLTVCDNQQNKRRLAAIYRKSCTVDIFNQMCQHVKQVAC